MNNEKIPYYKEWLEYWKNRREDNRRIIIRLAFLFLGFFPVLFLIVRPLYQLYDKEWIINTYPLLWFIVLIFCLRRKYSPFICPRCGKNFYTSGRTNVSLFLQPFGYSYNFRVPFRCVHCGLDMVFIKKQDVENGA